MNKHVVRPSDSTRPAIKLGLVWPKRIPFIQLLSDLILLLLVFKKRYKSEEFFAKHTKNQTIIPDRTATKRQKVSSFHI